MHALILAAGRASRIGSLVGSQDKTHLSVGGQPALARQLTTLWRHAVRRVTLVVSPHIRAAVADLVGQCANGMDLDVSLVVQDQPLGPGEALLLGLGRVADDESLLLVLADTMFDSVPPGDDWIAVAPASVSRRWCRVVTDGGGAVTALLDEQVQAGQGMVAVGVYRLADPVALRRAGESARAPGLTGELELSAILSPYLAHRPVTAVPMQTWRDVGDMGAIVRARRECFFTRTTNQLSVDSRGVLTKSGSTPGFRAEAAFLRDLPASRRFLFPQIYHVAEDLSSYQIEYIDLPTLAELYLYRVAPRGWWGGTMAGLIDHLSAHLWPNGGSASVPQLERECRQMYVHNLRKRWEVVRGADPVFRRDQVQVNGRWLRGGDRCVELLCEQLEGLSATPVPAFIHGDLNFSNILYSPGSATLRLLDPRGEFGELPDGGDLRYELAKLRHSYAGMYEAFVHGLFDLRSWGDDRFELRLGPVRTADIAEMDAAVTAAGYCLREVRVIEAALFLSMLPIHGDDPRRQVALFLRGITLADAACAGHDAMVPRAGVSRPVDVRAGAVQYGPV